MIEELQAYVEKNDLHNKALEYFWIAFNTYKNEAPEKYAKRFCNIPLDELDIFVYSIGLRTSQWPECNYSHVTITIFIHYGERQLGNYDFWFSLSEDVDDDDFLEIY